MSQRKKVNSPRANLIISLVFHSLAIGAIFFFAGREGMLGKRLKEITVSIAPKEKKPEPPKPKPAEPKVEPPKTVEAPKAANVAPPPQNPAVPPPAVEAPPAVAPPPVELPAFAFSDGAKDVQTTADANELYKGVVERALRSHWSRPENIPDDKYTAEIQLTLDRAGAVTHWDWIKGSGDKRWDESVRKAVGQTKSINRPPPSSFPDKFLVRFDVESEMTESAVQLSSK